MDVEQLEPRAQLAALCARGMDWHTDPARMIANIDRARRAAVLVLFGFGDDAAGAGGGAGPRQQRPEDLDVLLLSRAATLRTHSGQIAFPGGAIDDTDVDPAAAALREANEETGLDPAGVELLGTLRPLPLAVSNFLVTPTLAWWRRPTPVAPVDPGETSEVFRVPVGHLLDPENRAVTEFTGRGRTVRMPAFTVDGRVVWGFTGLVLAGLFDELGWARPWDHTRTVAVER